MREKGNNDAKPMCEAILSDPASSYWLRGALITALERQDPVDALADAKVLLAALQERCENLLPAAVGTVMLPRDGQGRDGDDE